MARGIFIALQVCGSSSLLETKNEAGRFNIVQPQIQARPCLIVLAARPGNLPEKKLQFSGTEFASASGRFMAGVAQRNKIPGLASLLGTRKTRFSTPGVYENCSLPPNSLTKLIVDHFD